MCNEKDFYKIPDYVIKDFDNGNKSRIELKLKSWRDYTPNQAQKLVDMIFKLMDKFGVDTPKYLDIKRYLEKKDIDYVKKVNAKFNGRIK